MRKQQIGFTLSAATLACFMLAGGLAGCRGGGGGSAPRGGILAPSRPAPRPLSRPTRAIWVTRFSYRYPDDVRTIIANCAQSGCNTVLWQVRGEGTVAYPSRIEPWSRQFEHADPGFDPLALAIEEAHRHGLRIEAYFNTIPGWHGPNPPAMRDQLWYTRPDWFLHDETGRVQPLTRFYMPLNPCWPEVRQYIASVVDEIVSRYDVDGVHLDYVRYVWDETPNAKQRYPRDARTVALYRRDTGLEPDRDARAWNSWRANQLTRLVQDIRETLNRRRPGATLTASVWRHPKTAYDEYLQNGVAWLRAGLVDALMPMAYSTDAAKLESDVRAYRDLVAGRRIVPGVGIYMHTTPEQVRAQLDLCVRWGGDWALFSYDALFPTAGDRSAKPGDARQTQAQRERTMRRAVLAEFPPR